MRTSNCECHGVVKGRADGGCGGRGAWVPDEEGADAREAREAERYQRKLNRAAELELRDDAKRPPRHNNFRGWGRRAEVVAVGGTSDPSVVAELTTARKLCQGKWQGNLGGGAPLTRPPTTRSHGLFLFAPSPHPQAVGAAQGRPRDRKASMDSDEDEGEESEDEIRDLKKPLPIAKMRQRIAYVLQVLPEAPLAHQPLGDSIQKRSFFWRSKAGI